MTKLVFSAVEDTKYHAYNKCKCIKITSCLVKREKTNLQVTLVNQCVFTQVVKHLVYMGRTVRKNVQLNAETTCVTYKKELVLDAFQDG